MYNIVSISTVQRSSASFLTWPGAIFTFMTLSYPFSVASEQAVFQQPTFVHLFKLASLNAALAGFITVFIISPLLPTYPSTKVSCETSTVTSHDWHGSKHTAMPLHEKCCKPCELQQQAVNFLCISTPLSPQQDLCSPQLVYLQSMYATCSTARKTSAPQAPFITSSTLMRTTIFMYLPEDQSPAGCFAVQAAACTNFTASEPCAQLSHGNCHLLVNNECMCTG